MNIAIILSLCILILLAGCTQVTEVPPMQESTNTNALATDTSQPGATEVPPTDTPVPTATLEPTLTPTQVTHNVKYVVFHDFSGDGEQNMDQGEPLLPDITIFVDGRSCVTGVDGTCVINQVPQENYLLSVHAPENFRYFSPNIYKEIPIADGFEIQVHQDVEIAIPIVEGPYRSPYPDIKSLTVAQWVDIDEDSCLGRFPDRNCDLRSDWLGDGNTYDGHQGFDVKFSTANEVDLYPMRAGTVFMLRNEGEGYELIIMDIDPSSETGVSYQMFNHLGEVFVQNGDSVDPGILIATGPYSNNAAIHIGIYVGVESGVHPLDGDFRIPPHSTRYVCPFDDKLWTGFGIFDKIFESIHSENGRVHQVYP